MELESIDHLVLTVADLDATIAFYTEVLGMHEITFAGGRKGLAFGDNKINLHVHGHDFEPHARAPTPGSADFCLLTETPLRDVMRHLAERGVDLVAGPVDKVGAVRPLRSVYIRDPDGNLVELANEVGS